MRPKGEAKNEVGEEFVDRLLLSARQPNLDKQNSDHSHNATKLVYCPHSDAAT
jgi:hypothetical protein